MDAVNNTLAQMVVPADVRVARGGAKSKKTTTRKKAEPASVAKQVTKWMNQMFSSISSKPAKKKTSAAKKSSKK